MKEYLKGVIISAFIMVALLSMTTGVSAMSIQARGGSVFESRMGDGTNMGVAIFFYEGRTFDLFAGYDSISASVQVDPDNPLTKVKSKTNAAFLGFQYKFQNIGSFTPHVSLAVTSTKTTVTFEPGASTLFEPLPSGRSIGWRTGLGVDYGIGESWSLGLEVIVYNAIYFYSTEKNTASQLTADNEGWVSAADLELRYHF